MLILFAIVSVRVPNPFKCPLLAEVRDHQVVVCACCQVVPFAFARFAHDGNDGRSQRDVTGHCKLYQSALSPVKSIS